MTAMTSAPPVRVRFQGLHGATEPRDATAYPLVTCNGSPYIELAIDGRRGLFLLDTGANISGLDRGWVRRAELPRALSAPVATQGTTGTLHASSAVLASPLTLGNGFFLQPRFLLQDFSRFAHPASGPQAGLIGTDLLNRYCLAFDYERGRVSLRLRQERRPRAGYRATSLRYERSLPTVTLRLDGVDFPCYLDTGSNNRRQAPSLDVNRALIERLRSAGVRLHERGAIAMAGIAGWESRRVLGQVGLEMGGSRFCGVELIVHERGPLAGPEPYALMGARLLARLRRFIIDPFDRLIWIHQPGRR